MNVVSYFNAGEERKFYVPVVTYLCGCSIRLGCQAQGIGSAFEPFAMKFSTLKKRLPYTKRPHSLEENRKVLAVSHKSTFSELFALLSLGLQNSLRPTTVTTVYIGKRFIAPDLDSRPRGPSIASVLALGPRQISGRCGEFARSSSAVFARLFCKPGSLHGE